MTRKQIEDFERSEEEDQVDLEGIDIGKGQMYTVSSLIISGL